MNIDINKDFEREYKDDFWLGFPLKECIGIVGAVSVMGIVGVLIWYMTKIPPNICVYFAVPCGVPILGITFYRYQDMSILQIIQEYFYYRKTRKITYDAGQWKMEDMKNFTTEIEIVSKKKRHGRRKMRGGKS